MTDFVDPGWNEDRHSVQKALLAAANKDLKVRSRNGALFSDSDSEEENEAQRTAAAIRQSFGNDFLNPVKVVNFLLFNISI